MDSTGQAKLVDDTARDVAGAEPLVRAAIATAARALEKGELASATEHLRPALRVLDSMSRLSVLLQRRLEGRPDEAAREAPALAAAGEHWAGFWKDFNDSFKARDYLRAADMLDHEFPAALDEQAACFRRLREAAV
jgi:hypothetical protein